MLKTLIRSFLLLFEVEVTSVVWRRRPGSKSWLVTTRCGGRGRVGRVLPSSASVATTFLGAPLPPAARRAHNAPQLPPVDLRPRNCAHTHSSGTSQPLLHPFTECGDLLLVICDEDFRGGSLVLLCGGQRQSSWWWEGRAAGGEIVKLF